MGLVLFALIPMLLSALSGWRKAREVGAFRAAVPVPAFLFSVSVGLGLFLISTDDWKDMLHGIGALLSLFGVVIACACRLVGWGAGRIRLRQDEQV